MHPTCLFIVPCTFWTETVLTSIHLINISLYHIYLVTLLSANLCSTPPIMIFRLSLVVLVSFFFLCSNMTSFLPSRSSVLSLLQLCQWFPRVSSFLYAFHSPPPYNSFILVFTHSHYGYNSHPFSLFNCSLQLLDQNFSPQSS